MHSFWFQSSLYSDLCKKFFLATLWLVTSAFNQRICQPGPDMQEKTSSTQGNHGGPMALIPPSPPPQQHHHHPSEDSTLGDAYLKQ